MSLFTVLPKQLFRPLASPSAQLYGTVLLEIFAETRQHHQPLSRELVIDIVCGQLEATSELQLDEHELELDDTSADEPIVQRASAIVRYLQQCGWLRGENQSDFSRNFTLPDYAFRLLNLLSELARNEPLPLQGLIYAIHSMLRTSVNEGNAHISIPEAHRQTNMLMNGLKELQHNIGQHIEQVLHQLEARAILEQVFLHYRDQILDKAYHQLRTSDHVSRFRPDILAALNHFSDPQQIAQISQQAHILGQETSIEETGQQLLNQIRDIREQFDTLDYLLETIDHRHSLFVDAAVRTIELRLNANTTTSGQLDGILRALLAGDNQLLEAVSDQIELYALSLIDNESLSAPASASKAFEIVEEARIELSEADIAAAQAQTLAQLNRSVSRERVRRYAAQLLAEQDKVRISDVVRPESDTLPLLIYLRQYGDGSLGYEVQNDQEPDWIESDGIGFRDFSIIKVS
jgi:hypothetical protein